MHSLFRSDFYINQISKLLVLGFKPGPYYKIHALYVISSNLISVGILSSIFWTQRRKQWPRCILLIFATILPVMVEILQPSPVKGFSMTTSCLLVSGVLYALAIFRHHLLDVVPLARAALFGQISEPVLVMDTSGELVDCNQSARQLAGNTLTPRLDEVYQAILARIPQMKSQLKLGTDAPCETYLEDTVEENRFWRVSISTITSTKKLQGYLVLLHDITELKRIEKTVLESKKQLETLNNSLLMKVEEETKRRVAQERLLSNHSRLAAMGEMIGAIAHQWRQPLATLGMIVQRTYAMAAINPLTPAYMDEFKANAMRQIKYMSDTIEEFRGFYRIEKQKILFSPYNCIVASIRLFEHQLTSSGIEIKISVNNCAEQQTHGHPNEFKQVILNLLANARDAILESRQLNHDSPKEGIIAIGMSLSDDSYILIDIRDNGCGVPADIAPRIFDPYFTTKNENGGTGIGLYMSRMIIEDSLEGRLSLLENFEGAVFRIELPLDKETCMN